VQAEKNGNYHMESDVGYLEVIAALSDTVSLPYSLFGPRRYRKPPSVKYVRPVNSA